MIAFFVPGKPQPKHRARATTFKGRNVGMRADPRTKGDEAAFLAVAWPHRPHPVPTGAIHLEITFVFEPPKSWTKKKKAAALAGELAHVVKPDLDNLVKHVKDSLNGVFYADDCQVISVKAIKLYGETAGSRVEICFVDRANLLSEPSAEESDIASRL